jgi:tRNA(Ile)-lysidine synthase
MDRIEQKFLKFIDEHLLLNPGEKILVGFSGGPDSVFLLHLLYKFRKRLKIEIYAVHINHLLRGKESDEDEQFCDAFCRSRGIKFSPVRKRVKSFSDKNKMSLEEAGRFLRYREYEKTLRKNKLDKIATAHNAGDNTETVLLNLVKGTGLDGISGIPVKRDNVIRPVLCFTREEIVSYLRKKNFSYRVDKTNEESDYERNYLRNKIIPLIKQRLNPKLDKAVMNSSENFKNIKEYILTNEAEIFRNLKRDSSGGLTILLEDLQKVNESLKGLLVKNLLERELMKQVFSDDLKKIFSLNAAQVGRRVELSGGIKVFRERNYLKFITTGAASENRPVKIHIGETKATPAGRISIRQSNRDSVFYSFNKNKEYISADTVGSEFIIRRWKPGDSFYPLGMKNSKKVSDFLNEQKVESSDKKNHLILVNRNNVVWIIGLRIDERFKVTSSTKEILELCLN